MSSSSTILEITPLLPWRPASLSPSAILRFLATNTRTRSLTPGGRSSPAVAREGHHVDDHAALAVGHLERGVAHLARLLLEDRADQLLLRGQLGLALGRDLAHQQVAGLDLGADAHDAAVVEVAQRLLRAVGDVARDLLVAQLGGAGVDLVLLDVDRGELVVLDQAAREDDRVLEVVALPGHEGDEQVLAQRHLAQAGGGAVGQHVARPCTFSPTDTRGRWWISVPWLERMNFWQRVLDLGLAGLDHHRLGVDVGHGPRRRRPGPRRRCPPRRGAPCPSRSAGPRS